MAEPQDNPNPGKFPLRFESAVLDSPDGKRTVTLVRLDASGATEQDILRLCGEPETIARAVKMRDAAAGATDWDFAIYIIASERDCAAKIGVSGSPTRRMEALQGGSPGLLGFTHLFWMPRRAAYGIETLALRVAERMGKRLTGEWVAMDAVEAATMVATLLKAGSIPFSDSAMFCQNVRMAFPAYENATASLARALPLYATTNFFPSAP